MRPLSKGGDFTEIDIFVYIK